MARCVGIQALAVTARSGNLKQREGDQPLPLINDEPYIHRMVIADVLSRMNLGEERYGTALQPHNGRDSLRDAYEEVLDLAVYLRQAIYERDNPVAQSA